MNQAFGLSQLWSQGDWVTRFVALLLLAMSLASWMVIITKALAIRRAAAQAKWNLFGMARIWRMV
jgi:biopolymer transport protein ExbB